MGSFFQSEEMCLVQLFFQTESAHYCISELGNLGLVQFRDLNPDASAFHRKFVNEVRKCEDMERVLRLLQKEMMKSDIAVAKGSDTERVPCPRDVFELESTLEKLEQELREINSNQDTLKHNFTELMEMKYLLQMAEDFFEQAECQLSVSELPSEDSITLTTSSRMARRTSSIASHTGPLKLGFVAGVIRHERFLSFEKILWRLFHGNFVLRHAEIQIQEEENNTEGPVKKVVFIIFIQGDHVRRKIQKICEGFHAGLYPCPNAPAARKNMRVNVSTRISDLKMILKKTAEYRQNVLTAAAGHIQDWSTKVRKMKAVYYTLNLCNIDITQKLIVAEIWCPVSDLASVQAALMKGSEQSGCSVNPVLNRIPTSHTPPTFNRTNAFTAAFQSIIDAYGVADYQEINPAPYTIVTFPFLFAIMFGDCGHGLVMSLLAVWVIYQEEHFRHLKNELIDVLVGGRYILLLMGLFSIYTGLIYNDCFSKSFNIFGSSWSVRPMFYPHGPWTNDTLHGNAHLQLDPAVPGVFSGSPYPFGIDPIWNIASNKLTFLNSYKMKMSVIIGVIHMLFGLTLSLVNCIYFRKLSNVVLQFVPELVFLLSLFGYLVSLILYKWSVALRSDAAPSLLLLFINMMLFAYEDAHHSMLFECQKPLQIFLVMLAICMVPWLLLAKPLLLYRDHNKQVFGSREQNQQAAADGSAGFAPGHKQEMAPGHKQEMVSMGDMFVYQAIHTIEYCLGCISNTTSYLRLWALSLAHAELSEVLWKMVLHVALGNTSGLGSVLVALIFAAFAALTVAVLLVMEGLSAFLHALRLHWVEFQNKFYKGSGYKFTPLCFDSLMSM
ncbi:V-type proton ATPase 116 kDa subunit a1 [Alosa sapidissima]|uniref:V-type proton ATPase 116 kDa subunit a1 n=1 Tax=Alosa sapidissima TaxID=34773 RepID=UPI001C094BB6|nr:V-type proton ATPase 116 kDa subunit a1 [Alosa sapidissima]